MSATTKSAPSSRQARFASCWPSVLHEVGNYPCQALNLSRTGALLIGDLPIPSVKKVGVSIGSPTRDLAFRATATVVRVVGGEMPGEVVIAVEFDALDERRAATLEKLIARAKEAPAPGGGRAADADRPAEGAATGRHEKASRAQRAQPEERVTLFQENDPFVFEGLARNLRLSKREIKALVERPNLLPTTLPILAAHPRTQGDETLLVQLAAHPSASLELAKSLAAGLSPAGIGRLLRATTLGDGLRSYLLRKFPKASTQVW